MKRTGRWGRKKGLRRRSAKPVTTKALEDACRAVVFARDGKRCAMCGTTDWIQWSHVYGRGRAPHIKYEPINGKPLCRGCHKFKWHEPPVGFDPFAWFREKFPGRLEEIQELSDFRKTNKINRREHLRWLESELRRLGG